jgi:hypothetical protein
VTAESSPIRAREYAVPLALTVLAFALRAFRPQAFGIDHFDEGVYAFSALGLFDPSQPHTLFPDQVLFSPPVHVALIAFA